MLDDPRGDLGAQTRQVGELGDGGRVDVDLRGGRGGSRWSPRREPGAVPRTSRTARAEARSRDGCIEDSFSSSDDRVRRNDFVGWFVLIESAGSGVLHRHLLSLGGPHRESRAGAADEPKSPRRQRLSPRSAEIARAGRASENSSPQSADPRETRGPAALAGSRQRDLAPVQIPVGPPRIDSPAVAGQRDHRRRLRRLGRPPGDPLRPGRPRRRPALSRLHLVVSDSALEVARGELSSGIDSPAAWLAHLRLPRAAARRIALHDNADIGASIASGSYPAAAMIVIPCSGGTLGSIANGDLARPAPARRGRLPEGAAPAGPGVSRVAVLARPHREHAARDARRGDRGAAVARVLRGLPVDGPVPRCLLRARRAAARTLAAGRAVPLEGGSGGRGAEAPATTLVSAPAQSADAAGMEPPAASGRRSR